MTEPQKITKGATFLTVQQIWYQGDGSGRFQKKLQVLKDYGTATGMSDLAIVLGAAVGSDSKTIENQRAGFVWSASDYAYGFACAVNDKGDRVLYDPRYRSCGARPVLPPSPVYQSKIVLSDSKPRKLSNGNTVQVVEYGEYPQTIAKDSDALEESFKKNSSNFNRQHLHL